MKEQLTKLVACPKCHQPLVFNPEKNILICEGEFLYYEIKDNIPVLLPREAKPYNKES